MNWNILRNVAGEFELGRVYLGLGGILAMVSPIGFEGWDMWKNGAHFDVTAWCVAYPGGLAALAALGLFSIGRKEKDIAQARVTTQGANP